MERPRVSTDLRMGRSSADGQLQDIAALILAYDLRILRVAQRSGTSIRDYLE